MPGKPAPHPDLVPGARVEWFRAAIDEWNRGDVEIDESWAHPDFKLFSMMMGGWVSGVDGLLRWQSEIRQQFESFGFTIERCEELPDDRLFALGSLHFRGRESGVEMDMDVGWMLTFRDGLLWRWRNYLSHAEAFAERNHELVKQAFERWNAGDYEIDYDTLDPDVELHTPLGSTSGTPYRGHDGFRRWVDDINDQFETWELVVDEWRPLDDGRLLGFGNIHAKGRGSGVELDQELAWLFAFRDEKLIRYHAFYSRDEGLHAAGLRD